ncbi:hypothetical protein DFH09DRAFT_1370654 [Mycena vulgaris]|nr:hypothetical protein DFH09DRAFT_1370654 [Mycena vulgaris]
MLSQEPKGEKSKTIASLHDTRQFSSPPLPRGYCMETLLASSSSKRARVDSRADKENVTTRSASKKARLEATTPAANPYKTLPPPTTKFIQLRFQLARFKGVYRVAKVPLNYTFANLYKLILFMFGWSGDHAHQAKVFSYVEMYSGNYKAGHIKRGGKDAPLPDTDDEIMLQYNESTRRTDIAEYEVVMMGRSTKSRARRYFFGDDFGDAEEKVEDQNLRLSQVWNQKLKKNGTAWTVHITMDHEEDFASVEPASNLPVMITGKIKGAPPVEDARNEIFGELEAHQKSISAVFFQGNAFERYLKGEITSRASKTALKVREVPQGAVSTLANARDVVATGSSDSDSYSESDSYEEREADGAQSRVNIPPTTAQHRSLIFHLFSVRRKIRLAVSGRLYPASRGKDLWLPRRSWRTTISKTPREKEYDSDDEIDEETAIVVGTLVLQQMYMAGLMILLVAKRRRLI